VWDLHEDRPAGGTPSVAPDDLVLVMDGSFLQRPRYLDEVDPESRADIVVDHQDPQRPTLR
jgi:hypothetical protein